MTLARSATELSQAWQAIEDELALHSRRTLPPPPPAQGQPLFLGCVHRHGHNGACALPRITCPK
jgi:hypothetical protein